MRFIHIIARSYNLFVPIGVQNSIVWIFYSVSTTLNGHLGKSQFRAIMIKALVNIRERVLWWSFFVVCVRGSIYLGVNLLGHMLCKGSVLIDTASFSKGLYQFTWTFFSNVWEFWILHILANTWYLWSFSESSR